MTSLASETKLIGLAAIAAVIIIGASWYVWHQLKKSRHQRHVVKVLESLGIKYLHNIVLPDGIEGLAFIDYLLLIPDGVVVLDINYSEGHLFGGESVDKWTQVINNKTYKFNNPLYDNQTRCQAVLWNVENTLKKNPGDTKNWKAHGWIAFSNAGNFPKGMPAQISMIDDLKNNLEEHLNIKTPASEATLSIWDQLHDLSISTHASIDP